MAARILVVEGEEPLKALLRRTLEVEGYKVDVVGCGDEAEVKLREGSHDLVILDWMSPGTSGVELCQRLRVQPDTEHMPVIMLTAGDPDHDCVRGLEIGADDCIIKPVSVPEFLARVRALLRRTRPSYVTSILRAADLELNRERRRVTRGTRDIHLGPTEFLLLEFLMQAPGRVFSREQLLDGVWARDTYIDERTVDVHIGRIRRAINVGNRLDPIRTVRGVGYAFKEEQYLRHNGKSQ